MTKKLRNESWTVLPFLLEFTEFGQTDNKEIQKSFDRKPFFLFVQTKKLFQTTVNIIPARQT